MNPLHSNDLEMSNPPRQTTIERAQSQDFQIEFIAKRKAVHDTEAIVEKLYEQAKQIHVKDLEELEAKENTWFGNFRRWLINLKHAFLNNIPAPNVIVLKDVQPVLFMTLAIFAYGTILGFFLYFFVSGVVTDIRVCTNAIIERSKIHTHALIVTFIFLLDSIMLNL